MGKLILVSILLTAVYSWEELKRTLRVLLYAVLYKERPREYFATHLDEFVSLAIVFAAVPVSLMVFLSNPGNFFAKLLYLALTLLGASLVAASASILMKRRSYVGLVLSLVSVVSPAMQAFENAVYLPRKTLAKFAALMSIPPITGLLMKGVVNPAADPSLLPNIDLLIYVLVGGLFIQITIGLLKDFLGSRRFRKVSVYYRVVLGIALTGLVFGPIRL